MSFNTLSKTISVATTTANVVDAAKDVKGLSGFEAILDIFKQVFKALWWVVKGAFKVLGWVLVNQVDTTTQKDEYYDPMTSGGYYDDIDHVNK